MASGLRRFPIAAGLLAALSVAARAGDYVFVNPPYLAATQAVIGDAHDKAPAVFRDQPVLLAKFDNAERRLADDVDQMRRAVYFKKASADMVNDVHDKEFSDALNDFKDALNGLSDAAETPLEKLLPSYADWNRLETSVVKTGLNQRISAFKTRYGPDSEPINVLELLISQEFMPGDESGPSPWEPILRVEAVQVTTTGKGLTSTVQAGANYYFVNGEPPKALQWLTVSNHVGVAAMLQYLDDPGVLQLKGRPSFGVMLHVDRKEIGVAYDPGRSRLRLTLGYAFQFVPMLM